jgi:tetratricopeptide (TPR) repeat protein
MNGGHDRSLCVLTAAVLSVAWLAFPARAADDDAALRRRALALNDVTGDDPIKGEVKALVGDPKGTRKLLAVAVSMAKEKDQPFTYNAAYILASAALRLKELETSRAFFRVCAEQAGKLQSAQKLVQAYTGMMLVIDALYRDKKYDASVNVAKEFLEALEKQGVSARIKADVLRQMIRAMTKQGKVDEANRMVDTLVKARDADWRNLELKAWLEKETKRFDDAAKTYKEVLDLIAKDETLEKEDREEVQSEVRREWLGVLAKQGKVDEANKIVDGFLKGQEDNWRLLELKAALHQETGQYDKAAKAYEDMIERIGKDKALDKEGKERLQSTIRYILSGVYVDMDKVDKAAEQLKALLAKDPDSPTFNNDLGYIWADHDMNLDESEKMIRKALEEDRKQRKARADLGPDEDRDNAAYLDSLGWVLFKKKQYPEAKKYLLEATQEKDGQHIEILDHLADTHLALGEKAEAVAVWKKALQVETNSKREQQRKLIVEKKLKANQ